MKTQHFSQTATVTTLEEAARGLVEAAKAAVKYVTGDAPDLARDAALQAVRREFKRQGITKEPFADARVRPWFLRARLIRVGDCVVMEGEAPVEGLRAAATWLYSGLMGFHEYPHCLGPADVPPQLTLFEINKRLSHARVALSRKRGHHTLTIPYDIMSGGRAVRYVAELSIWTQAAWLEEAASPPEPAVTPAADYPLIRQGRKLRAATQAELDDIAALQRRQDELVNGP